MRFCLVLLVALVLLSPPAQAQAPPVQLEERAVLDGQIALLVPQQFTAMSREMIKLKYPAQQRPEHVLTNNAGTVNIALRHTSSPVTPNQIPTIHQAMEQMFRRRSPNARWNRSEVIERGNQRGIVLDLWTPALDTEIRNIMLGMSVDNRFLLISFNVTQALEETYGKIGEQIIRSVRVIE